MFNKGIVKVISCCLLLIYIQGERITGHSFQDQTSPRTNTLFDDADDIQRQLDNEARDRMKFGRPKTIWVFHFPTHFPDQNVVSYHRWRIKRETTQKYRIHKKRYSDDTTPALPTEWNYDNQHFWKKMYPRCGGRSQSPVNLPSAALIKARGARALLFHNFDVVPKDMTLVKDGRRITISGTWDDIERPMIYGGALHSRRYLFHSLTFHWPSEHEVEGLQYPMETQAFFRSAEYRNLDCALNATNDLQSVVAISSMHKYSPKANQVVEDLLQFANATVSELNRDYPPTPISQFCPPFKQYACYHGSLPVPPCTESVLWMMRAKTLLIGRNTMDVALTLMSPETKPLRTFSRSIQPLNDRRVMLFT